MNYTTLQANIADWLNRDDLTTVIPQFIALTEAELNRTLRVRQMLRNADTTISSVSVTLPTDFLELRHVTLSSQNAPLYQASYAELDDIRRNKNVAAQPTHVAVFKNKLEFAPVPDQSYTCEIVYYQQLGALSSSNATNWLSDDHHDVYLYGSLTKAAPYLGEDERTNAWRQEYASAIQQLNANSERSEGKGIRKSLAFNAI